MDRVLGGLRVDHVDALHPAQPGRARDRAAGLGVRLPQGGAPAPRPAARRAGVRPLLGGDALLHGYRRRGDRLRTGAGRQRGGGRGHQLAECAARSSRAPCSLPPAPTSRPCSWSATPAGAGDTDLERYFSARALVAAARRRRHRGRGDLRLPRRRSLHLRRADQRGAAAGDPLGGMRSSPCSHSYGAASTAACARSPWARSWR